MKNICLNNYFVPYILSSACEWASLAPSRKPRSYSRDRGFTIFPLPLNSQIPDGILWMCLSLLAALGSLHLTSDYWKTDTLCEWCTRTRCCHDAGSFHFLNRSRNCSQTSSIEVSGVGSFSKLFTALRNIWDHPATSSKKSSRASHSRPSWSRRRIRARMASMDTSFQVRRLL